MNHWATHGHALVFGICSTADLADLTENQLVVPVVLTLCLELVAMARYYTLLVQLHEQSAHAYARVNVELLCENSAYLKL